jgi:formate/nitrite transporter FocA (FNT family)
MDEDREVEERRHLRSPVAYEIVRREADAELARPASSLWWSGIAAGMTLSSSWVQEEL